MALLGFEGFDAVAANPQQSGFNTYMPFDRTGGNAWWTAVQAGGFVLAKTPGLLGGSALILGSVSDPAPTINFNSTYSTFIIGVRYLMPFGTWATSKPLVTFMDGTTNQCGIAVNTGAYLIFWTGTTATVLATGTTHLVPGSWYYIEIKVTINNSTGSFTVRLAGTGTEITASGVDTQTTANAYLNGVKFNMWDAGVGIGNGIDDIYACDTTGPAPYNDFLGALRVETLFPNANSTFHDWTPLAGTNWQEVSEVNMDSNTSYNSETGAGIDTFGHPGLSSTPLTIFAADVIAWATKTDVQNLAYRTKLISGGTTSNGTDSNLATVYVAVRDSYQTNPDTGLAWTATTINATDFGYERH